MLKFTADYTNPQDLSSSYLTFVTQDNIADPGFAVGDNAQKDEDQNKTNFEEMFRKISEQTAEINSLKKTISSLEGTLQPILQILPDLITFMRKNLTNGIEKDPSIEIPKLPFKTVGEVEDFNNKLKDVKFSDQMVIYLKSEVDGRKINRNIRNIILKLIDPDTLNQFTWTGAVNIRKGMSASKRILA